MEYIIIMFTSGVFEPYKSGRVSRSIFEMSCFSYVCIPNDTLEYEFVIFSRRVTRVRCGLLSTFFDNIRPITVVVVNVLVVLVNETKTYIEFLVAVQWRITM